MNLNDKIDVLKGIGKKKSECFKNIGIETIKDIIFHIPRRYEDRSVITNICDMVDNQYYLFKATVLEITQPSYKSKKNIITLKVSDETMGANIIFMNNHYIFKKFKLYSTYYFYAKAKRSGYSIVFFQPEFSEDLGFGINCVYSLSNGITQNDMKKIMNQLKDFILEVDFGIIYKNEKLKYNINQALYNLHFPTNLEYIYDCKKTLIYYELFLLLLSIKYLRESSDILLKTRKYEYISLADVLNLFKFELTNDQKKAISDIFCDMDSEKVMNRLIQGDVGSGKTAVAIASIYKTIRSGYQAVFMAPTEILAKQHYESLCTVFPLENIVLLTSSSKKRKKILEEILFGSAKIVVGTHSVFSDDVIFKQLALVITDEQHRFGVKQRQKIIEKGEFVDNIVMSATPIPRTLSLILYGNMSISEIHEMPKNRKKIETFYIKPQKENDMFKFIEERINNDERAYFIVPLINDSENMELDSINSLYDKISPFFKNSKIGILHSKLDNEEKQIIMEDFQNGNIKILISTTVVEVGVDIKKATIIVIYNSERFGLAQLHQLRGRVGRNEKKSYCFLLSNNLSLDAKKRIKIMVECSDGFEIANKDLELRGAGEIIGDRQHGDMNLKFADITRDIDLLYEVQKDVEKIDIKKIDDEYLKKGLIL